MTKKEVQSRVSKDGKPLDLNKFEWNENTNTFSSNENYLVLDFNTSYGCTFNTGSGCTFDTGEECVIVRRDVYEVIELEGGKKIKLNEHNVKGFTYVDEKPSLSGKIVSVELDGVKYSATIN